MINRQTYTQTLLPALLGLALLIFVAWAHQELNKMAIKYFVNTPRFYLLLFMIPVSLFLFGVIIESKRLFNYFGSKGGVSKPLLILSLGLIIAVMIPHTSYLQLLGFPGFRSGSGILSALLASSIVRAAAAILAGILLIRSLRTNNVSESGGTHN